MTRRHAATWQPRHLEEFLKSPQIKELVEKEPVSDEQRVNLLLRLANGEPLLDSVWNAVQEGTTNDSSPDAAIRREIREGELFRESVIPALEGLLPDQTERSKAEVHHAQQTVEDWTRGTLASIPTVVTAGRRVRLVHRVIASSPAGAVGYAFVLLSTTLKERLRRCHHESCGKFFLTPDLGRSPGRRRDTYCSPRCATSGSRERVRKYMQKKRADQKARRRGGHKK